MTTMRSKECVQTTAGYDHGGILALGMGLWLQEHTADLKGDPRAAVALGDHPSMRHPKLVGCRWISQLIPGALAGTVHVLFCLDQRDGDNPPAIEIIGGVVGMGTTWWWSMPAVGLMAAIPEETASDARALAEVAYCADRVAA